jgi:thiamine-phosphate pyrophosphorylase
MSPLISPGLYLIVNLDWHVRDRVSVVEFCRRVLGGGCSAVQLRFKRTPDRAAVEDARRLRDLTWRRRVPLIVNDRPDIALLCGADGVHVGQEDLPAAVVSKHFPGLSVGLSTHTLRQVRKIPGSGIDYIGFGPVFGTRSKNSLYPATGLEALGEAVRLSPVPVVAIGGIDERGCRKVVGAGARRAAVLSALYRSRDPAAAARSIHAVLLEGL